MQVKTIKYTYELRNRRLCSRSSPIILSKNKLFMLKKQPIMLHLRPIMLELFPNYNLKTMSRNMLFTYKIPMHSLLYPTIHDQTPHIQTNALKIHISYNSIGSQAIQVMTTNMQKSIITTIQVELCVVCGVSIYSFLELKFRQSIFFRNS